MANAVPSAGADLQVYSGGSWLSVALVKGISGPELTADDIDITVLLSSGRFKEFTAGFADGGEVTLEILYSSAQFIALYALFRVTAFYRVVLRDTFSATFQGYLKQQKLEVPLEDAVQAPVTIKVTGTWTLSAGTTTPTTTPA